MLTQSQMLISQRFYLNKIKNVLYVSQSIKYLNKSNMVNNIVDSLGQEGEFFLNVFYTRQVKQIRQMAINLVFQSQT